jgi:tetratricopeptide (TPR) repeat protein
MRMMSKSTRTTKRRIVTAGAATILLLCGVGQVLSVESGEPTEGGVARDENPLPAGLVDFLRARTLESEDRYRDALEAYDRALAADSTVVEVKVGYADLLYRLGMTERAVALLDGLQELDWHGRRIFALALAQLSVQKPERMEEAEAALRSVLEERDDDPNLLLSLGQLLHRMGKIEEAEEVIAELRRNHPSSPQLVSYHATLLRQLNRKQEALELFAGCAASGVTAAFCRDAAVDLLIELDRPGEAADLVLATASDEDLDELMRAGFLLWDAGRPTQGLQVVNRVLRQVPDSERGRTLKAHLLSATGRFEEAADEFRALLKKNPGDVDLGLSMAWAVAQSGDLDEARRWLDRTWERVAEDAGSADAVRCAVTGARVELVAGNPMLARNWLARVADPTQAGEDYVRLLGESYRREEDWSDGISAMVRLQPRLTGDARSAAEAVEAELRFRAADPRAWQRLRPLLDSDMLRNVLLGIQVLQSLERWPDIERETEAALQRFPDDRDLRFARASALERLDRLDDAEAVFLGLLEDDPDDASIANYLGYLWADRDVRLDEALELINRAVAKDPENPAYLDSLGWVNFRLGNLEQAEFWLRRAIAIDDSDGTVLAHLGEVLVARGEIDEGKRFLRVALERGSEHPERVRSLLDTIDHGPVE